MTKNVSNSEGQREECFMKYSYKVCEDSFCTITKYHKLFI